MDDNINCYLNGYKKLTKQEIANAIPITRPDFIRLKNYFHENDIPYVRPKRRGDKALYVGKSLGSDEICLYDKNVKIDEDYPLRAMNSASRAKSIVCSKISSHLFKVNEHVICILGTGFQDRWGSSISEITFPSIFSVSLLQHCFDILNIPICLCPHAYEWEESVHDVFNRERREQRRLEKQLLESPPPLALEPLPIGEQLCNALKDWLPYALTESDYLNRPYTSFLCTAIRGRAVDVLNYLDASDDHTNKQIAEVIRAIGAKPLINTGFLSGMSQFGKYGWLGKELGNPSWTNSSRTS